MRLHVHGARGSSPVSGAEFARYGGHTTCFEVEPGGGGERLIIDAGSGLLRLQATLNRGGPGQPFVATVVLTHLHWDHIQGLPFFQPVYAADSRIRVLAAVPEGFTVASAIDGVMRPPWFPARPAVQPGLTFERLPDGPFRVGSLTVTTAPLAHPGGVTGYRITEGERSLVVATDVEAGDPSADGRLIDLARGATMLVHDAQYTPEEWATTRSGWGHSTWQHATQHALAAGVTRLVTTSHDPSRDDDAVDAIVRLAREYVPGTEGAAEGTVLDV